MRMPRIKIRGRAAVYHCLSRTVGNQRLFGDLEKEKLRLLLWRQARFCGLQIITYCLMDNHFHILVRVPEPVELSDLELLKRVQEFYSPRNPFRQLLERTFREQRALPVDLRLRLTRRMGDLSIFIKEFKERFSHWYNKQANRFGTLWAERFTSVLAEDQPSVLQTVAAYVDLNPVRAGIVEDPAQYRWCAYAEAVAGRAEAQAGLMRFHPGMNWTEASRAYRQFLFVDAGRSAQPGKRELDRGTILKVLERGGRLPIGELLRLKIGYMSRGVVLGSKQYVNQVFTEFRDQFGQRRRSGARPLKALPGTFTIRNLQKKVFQ